MATDIVMPNAGFDTQEARILEWVKQPGEAVSKGDVIAVIESDKANVELESIASGVLLEHMFEVDVDVPIGAVIARVGSADEAPSPGAYESNASPMPVAASASATASDTGDMKVSPVARRLADENNLDLARVTGTGPRGRITKEDVERHVAGGNGASGGEVLALPKVRKAAREAGVDLAAVPATGSRGQITMDDLHAYQQAASAPTPAAAPSTPATGASAPAAPAPTPISPGLDLDAEGVTEVPMSRMRQIIAKRLSQSMQEAPHFYVTGEFDLEPAMKAAAGKLRFNDLIQYLTVRTLMRVPELNATFEGGRLFHHESVNLAIAVALDNGLLTPVVHGADRYSMEGLAKESKGLIRRARDGRVKPEELRGGTFTISNLGVIKQVDHFTAVINPPQVGIAAIGTVKQRPVVIDGGLHLNHTVNITVSGDHRAVDGMHLGRFMATFQEELDKFS